MERLVLIEWQDSHVDSSWCQVGHGIEDGELVCRSVGWLLLDGENAKVVAPHINQPEDSAPLQGCGVMTIPSRAVLRITDVTPHDTTNGQGTTSSSCPEPALGPTPQGSSPASESA